MPKMEQLKYRVVIEYLVKKELSPKEIFDDMTGTLGDNCPSYSAVKFWVREFKQGRTNVFDKPRSGQPKLVTTDANVKAVNDMVMADRRVTI